MQALQQKEIVGLFELGNNNKLFLPVFHKIDTRALLLVIIIVAEHFVAFFGRSIEYGNVGRALQLQLERLIYLVTNAIVFFSRSNAQGRKFVVCRYR